jgi:hypothetical protein
MTASSLFAATLAPYYGRYLALKVKMRIIPETSNRLIIGQNLRDLLEFCHLL